MKLLIFVGILQVLRFDFKKFRILEILNFHPCYAYIFRNYDNVPLVASCEFVSYTVKIASGVIDKVKYYYHTEFVCLLDLIPYVPSTIFQLCRDTEGVFLVEPVLS